MARRGARFVDEDQATASDIWRLTAAKEREEPRLGQPEAWEDEVWIEDDEPETEPATSTPAKPASGRRSKQVPQSVVSALRRATTEKRGNHLANRLADAHRSYERGRFEDARVVLASMATETPDVGAVRHLLGLTYYGLERWAAAAKELEAYRALSGDVDELPVLADCYRALKRWALVDQLWLELKEASPGAAIVAEGRIVAAGSLADRGRLADAVALLEKANLGGHHIEEHHLRLWYALADLYERTGDMPRARQLFARIAEHDRDFYDAHQRARALS